MNMKRIAIIGCGGAGKSTFSRRLSEKLNLPFYHLDSFFWKPGWAPTPDNEWKDVVKDLANKPEWIIDGNYMKTIDIRLENADTVIYLDMPRYLCLYRVIKRRLMYSGKSRPDMGEGCTEQIDWEFIKWIWNFNNVEKPQILEKLKAYSDKKNIIIFKNPSEAESFIRNIKSGG